ILPAPYSIRTVNKRGFDHIRIITDLFVENNKLNYLEDFKKIKETKAQHTLDLEDRMKNLSGSISCHKDLKDKCVRIFDDIITSSNTIKEMIKVLENSKTKDIKILSLCSSHKVL